VTDISKYAVDTVDRTAQTA